MVQTSNVSQRQDDDGPRPAQNRIVAFCLQLFRDPMSTGARFGTGTKYVALMQCTRKMEMLRCLFLQIRCLPYQQSHSVASGAEWFPSLPSEVETKVPAMT